MLDTSKHVSPAAVDADLRAYWRDRFPELAHQPSDSPARARGAAADASRQFLRDPQPVTFPACEPCANDGATATAIALRPEPFPDGGYAPPDRQHEQQSATGAEGALPTGATIAGQEWVGRATSEEPADSEGPATAGESWARLQAGGLVADVESYAWEDDPAQPGRKVLWLVGLVGTRAKLEAVWANLVGGKDAVLAPGLLAGNRTCGLKQLGGGVWKFREAPLPEASGVHWLIYPTVAHCAESRLDFLLLSRRPGDEAALHHRYLNERVGLPLDPAWRDWLWERALATGEARAIETHCASGAIARIYRCEPNAEALAEALALAVRARAVPHPVPGHERRRAVAGSAEPALPAPTSPAARRARRGAAGR